MSEEKATPYIAIVFPDAKSARDITQLKALANAVLGELTVACRQAPTSVLGSETKLVLLVSGEHTAIVKALQKACQRHDDRWLLAQVGTPCAANGLATADGWIRSHSLGAKT